MARSFNGSSDKLVNGTALFSSTAAFTVAAWVRPAVANAHMTVWCCTTAASNNHSYELYLAGATGGDPVIFFSRGTSSVEAVTSSGFTAGQWHHVCGINYASNSRAAFIDGGSKGTNGSTSNPSGMDQTSIGLRDRSTESQFFNGAIAEVVVWNVALTDAEVAMLARGVSPLRIRRANIVAYHPLHGTHSPEISHHGGSFAMTVTGTAVADHPPVAPPFAFISGWRGTQTTSSAEDQDILAAAADLEAEAAQAAAVSEQAIAAVGADSEAEALAASAVAEPAILAAPAEAEIESLAASVQPEQVIHPGAADTELEALAGTAATEQIVDVQTAETDAEAVQAAAVSEQAIEAVAAESEAEALAASTVAEPAILAASADAEARAEQATAELDTSEQNIDAIAADTEAEALALQARAEQAIHALVVEAEAEALAALVEAERLIAAESIDSELDAVPAAVVAESSILAQLAELEAEVLDALVAADEIARPGTVQVSESRRQGAFMIESRPHAIQVTETLPTAHVSETKPQSVHVTETRPGTVKT